MTKTIREPYQFAIVGSSGRGKTMSFRNMKPETCGFINMENKPLPFINKYKNYSKPTNWQDCYRILIEYAKNSEITEVVFDSFSAYVDSLLASARANYKGFDVWNFYNEEIGKLLNLIKRYPKDIFVTAHYEWVQTEEGAIEKRIKIKGKEWEGLIEKEFTFVLYTDVNIKENKRDYFFQLNSKGKDSAKTPPMFFEGKEQISNDSEEVLSEVRKVLSNNN